MSTDLVTRLRAANPVDGREVVQPPGDLLGEITALPREPRRRRRRWRAGLLVPAVALLVVAGALAGDFPARYFDEEAPVPANVLDALERGAARWAPVKRLDPSRAALAYVIDRPAGSVTGYYAPYAEPPGFCTATVRAGEPIGVQCSRGWGTAEPPILALTGTTWFDDPTAPTRDGVRALVGQLDRDDYTVWVVFEDDTSEPAVMQGAWFAYVVSDVHAMPGRRPARLSVIGASGAEVQRTALQPRLYNTRDAALAAVPASDGSRAQDAIRNLLLGESLRDGGERASRTDIAATRDVAVDVPGHDIHVYLAPTNATGAAVFPGVLVIGVVDGKREWWSESPRKPAETATFELGTGSRVTTSVSTVGLLELTGPVPLGATRVVVRLEDGSEHTADAIVTDTFFAWVDAQAPGTTPVELIAYDAAGGIVARQSIDPAGCFRRGCLFGSP